MMIMSEMIIEFSVIIKKPANQIGSANIQVCTIHIVYQCINSRRCVGLSSEVMTNLILSIKPDYM